MRNHQDDTAIHADQLRAMRERCGIEVITTVYLSGYVSHAVWRGGKKIATRRALEQALGVANDLAGRQ